MTQSAAEAEREVEASRSQVDRTMEALKEKMTPGQLFDEAARSMGGAGNQLLAKFLEQAKENPMPLAVMGLGLAWLMTSSNRQHGAPQRYMPVEPRSFGDKLAGAAHAVSDKAHAAAEGISDKAHAAAEGVSDAFSSARGSVGGAASDAVEQAKGAADKLAAAAGAAKARAEDYGQRATQTVSDLLDREPLLIAGIGLVAGLAIGASLPATEAEKKLMGPMRDRLVDKTKAFAEGRLEEVKDAAQAAISGVTEELKSGGEGDLADRVGDVARAGVAAAKEELGGDGVRH